MPDSEKKLAIIVEKLDKKIDKINKSITMLNKAVCYLFRSRNILFHGEYCPIHHKPWKSPVKAIKRDNRLSARKDSKE